MTSLVSINLKHCEEVRPFRFQFLLEKQHHIHGFLKNKKSLISSFSLQKISKLMESHHQKKFIGEILVVS
jgi:hypothetical protein